MFDSKNSIRITVVSWLVTVAIVKYFGETDQVDIAIYYL